MSTFTFYLSKNFKEYFYFYLSKKFHQYLYFYLSRQVQYFAQHWRKWTSYVKAFDSYRITDIHTYIHTYIHDRQTDKQVSSKLYYMYAALRVVFQDT